MAVLSSKTKPIKDCLIPSGDCHYRKEERKEERKKERKEERKEARRKRTTVRGLCPELIILSTTNNFNINQRKKSTMEYLFTDTDQLPVCFKLTYHELVQLNKFLATATVVNNSDHYNEFTIKGIIKNFNTTLNRDVKKTISQLNDSLNHDGENNA